MDDSTMWGLAALAGLIGLSHTVLGPDHYIPFIAMSKARSWSMSKTAAITLICGIGHVFSSIVIGGLGIAVGAGVGKLERFEHVRGDIAGWLLLGFGLAYLVWGLRRAIRNRPHTHVHAHGDGTVHLHEHQHTGAHLHPHCDHHHERANAPPSITPWVLFTIFVFGPCEPLIPLLMYPAAKLSLWGVILVAAVFAVVTLATMLVVVLVAYAGLMRISCAPLARYSHAIAGSALLACGVAIKLGM